MLLPVRVEASTEKPPPPAPPYHADASTDATERKTAPSSDILFQCLSYSVDNEFARATGQVGVQTVMAGCVVSQYFYNYKYIQFN